MPYILEALDIAAGSGLNIPLVYNTGGYDSVDTLKMLDGIIDIYMPDMKYSDDRVAGDLSGVTDYVTINRAAVKEMHRQVGDLEMDGAGVAERGLLVRHLVLPDGLAGTGEVVRFLTQDISTDTYLNIMDQYHPCYRAGDIPRMSRPVSAPEFAESVSMARRQGLDRLDRYNSPALKITPSQKEKL